MTRTSRYRRKGLVKAHANRSDVVFEPSEGWWVASLPGIPGAYTQGATRDAAFANLLDVLSLVEWHREHVPCRGHKITEAEREDVERRLTARFESSADKDGPQLAAMLSTLWELRRRRGYGALVLREELRRRMRWELSVRAREDARDLAAVRAWLASPEAAEMLRKVAS
jgi:predicted RNase H-like HicB family nuclease